MRYHVKWSESEVKSVELRRSRERRNEKSSQVAAEVNSPAASNNGRGRLRSGERLAQGQPTRTGQSEIVVVQNWFEELKARVPVN